MSQPHHLSPAEISTVLSQILQKLTDLEHSMSTRTASLEARTDGLSESMISMRQSVDELGTTLRTTHIPAADKKPAKDSLNSRIPTLRFINLNSDDIEMLSDNDNIVAKFHRAGGVFKNINGWSVQEQKQFGHRPARQTLMIYLKNWGSLDKLREQRMAIKIVELLGLSTQVCLEREICWVQIYHLINLRIKKPEQLKRNAVSWKDQSKLKIHKVDFKCGKLLIAFENAAEAEKACNHIFWMDHLPFMAVPINIKGIPVFCLRCGRPGHMANECPQSNGQRPGENFSCLYCGKKHTGHCLAKKDRSLQDCLNCRREGRVNRKHNTESVECPCDEVRRYRALCKVILEGDAPWIKGRNISSSPQLPFSEEEDNMSANNASNGTTQDNTAPNNAQSPSVSTPSQATATEPSQPAPRRRGRPPINRSANRPASPPAPDTGSSRLLPLGQQDYLNHGATRQSRETQEDTPAPGSSRTAPIHIEDSDPPHSSESDKTAALSLGPSQSSVVFGQPDFPSSISTMFSAGSSDGTRPFVLPNTTSTPEVVPETRDNTPVQKRKRVLAQAAPVEIARSSGDRSGNLLTDGVSDHEPAPQRRRIFATPAGSRTAVAVVIKPKSNSTPATASQQSASSTKMPEKAVTTPTRATCATAAASSSSSKLPPLSVKRKKYLAGKLLPLSSTGDRELSLPPISRTPTPEASDDSLYNDGELTDGSMDESDEDEDEDEDKNKHEEEDVETDYSVGTDLFDDEDF